MRPLLESPVELAGLAPRSETANGFDGGATLEGEEELDTEGEVMNGCRVLCGNLCVLLLCGGAWEEDDVEKDGEDIEGGIRLFAPPVLCSIATDVRCGGVISICGSSVEDRERPARAAGDGCEVRDVFELPFGTVEFAAGDARSPPPVKAVDICLPPEGMRVEDLCRPPGEERDMGEGDAEDAAESEALNVAAETKGAVRVVVTGESEETVEVAVAEGEELPKTDVGAVGLEEVLPDPELTILIVACVPDSRLLVFRESWEGGREVTAKAGGGDRSRMGVGTIGLGSVRSYAAAAFGDGGSFVFALGRGAGDGDGDGDSVLSGWLIGAVWLRAG